MEHKINLYVAGAGCWMSPAGDIGIVYKVSADETYIWTALLTFLQHGN